MTTVTEVQTPSVETVAGWLAVGGSWHAIATASGWSDVDAFRHTMRPLLAARTAHALRMGGRRTVGVQLALFDAATEVVA